MDKEMVASNLGKSGNDISLKERRRRLLEEVNSRDIPESVKEIDPVKLIREDRDR